MNTVVGTSKPLEDWLPEYWSIRVCQGGGVRTLSEKTSYLEMLLENQIKGLFKAKNCDGECIDPMGYDIRLGDEILFVTRGETRKLKRDEVITVYPGETLLVKSEEILNLPADVCALGSPKMSLIGEGLWAHGGKTDFGFNERLTLGFRHFGASPVQLTRGQRIFHLTFLRIHNKVTEPYSGKGIGFPPVVKSPLDNSPRLSEELENKVKEVEAIQSARILRITRREISTLKSMVLLGAVASVIIVLLGLVALILPSLQYISIPGMILTAIVQSLVSAFIDRFRSGRLGSKDKERL